MSLQDNVVLTQFVANCHALWTRWNRHDGHPHRSGNREARVRAAVVAMTNFMVAPQVTFQAISGWGSFSWTSWTLTLNNRYTNKNDIKYGKFVEFCSTIYHETRHAEQFYRIAQGLALGRLKYPDKSERQIVQNIGGSNLSVRQKIGLFGGGGGVQPAQLLPDARNLSTWLNIPLNVAQHAHNSRAGFTTFIGLPKPAWFKRATILLEVEDWMRATYKGTYGEMDSFAQSEDDDPNAIRENVYNMYRSLPEENDAHAIEDLVVQALTTSIGHAGSENERRTNVGLFG